MNQFCTYEQAQAIAAQLAVYGGGVKRIFIQAFGGPFVAPSAGLSANYQIRFNNTSLINAGLALYLQTIGMFGIAIMETMRGGGPTEDNG